MSDINVILFHCLLKQHKYELAKLTRELEWYKSQLGLVRETRALMRFIREQERAGK